MARRVHGTRSSRNSPAPSSPVAGESNLTPAGTAVSTPATRPAAAIPSIPHTRPIASASAVCTTPLTSTTTPTRKRLPSTDAVVIKPCTIEESTMPAESSALSSRPPKSVGADPRADKRRVERHDHAGRAAREQHVKPQHHQHDGTEPFPGVTLAEELRETDQPAVRQHPGQLRAHGRQLGRATVDGHELGTTDEGDHKGIGRGDHVPAQRAKPDAEAVAQESLELTARRQRPSGHQVRRQGERAKARQEHDEKRRDGRPDRQREHPVALHQQRRRQREGERGLQQRQCAVEQDVL